MFRHLPTRIINAVTRITSGVKKTAVLAWLAVSSISVATAWAKTPTGTEPGSVALCGVLERTAGDAQLLDPSRTQLLDTLPRTGLPCGSWASVGEAGVIALRLKEGFRIQIGAGSFVQLVAGPEQLIVYRGQVHAESQDSSGELRILTPNARARMSRGKAMVVYSLKTEESQLVTLENKASLENRFKPHPKVFAKAGEATSVNFKLMRSAPSTARAVSVAALKEKLALLPLDEHEQADAIQTARLRGERRIPASLKEEEGASSTSASGGARVPASDRSSQYLRHRPDPENDELKKKMHDRAVAGIPASKGGGEKLLFPTRKGRPQMGASSSDPGEVLRMRKQKQDESEKSRLLEELSKELSTH